MVKNLVCITISERQRKIIVKIYERLVVNNRFNDEFVDIIRYFCQNIEDIYEKLKDLRVEYASYDQDINFEN